MPKRDKFRKQHNQPSVASIFTGNISTNSSPQAECENPNPPPSPESSTPIVVPRGLDLSELIEDTRNFIPVNKNRRKKRRWEIGDSTEKTSPSENNNCNKNKKRPKTGINMEVDSNTEGTTNPHMPEEPKERDFSEDTPLSKEMKMLEKRLKESLQMMLKETMNAVLKPIQESIDKLQASQSTMEAHEIQIVKLQKDNVSLTEEVTHLKAEMHGVQVKLNKLEDMSLESNLILHGIEEQSPDDLEARIKKVYNAISSTINRDTPAERLVVAHEVEIVRTRRLGKADQNKTRPLNVEFASKYDAEQIFANRFSMDQGIYVDREFCFETEKARHLLRPVLKAAKGIKEYNCKCRLEGNQLVLDGKRHTKDTLDQLLRNLDVMKITTKSDEKSLGFFGELCPLSNFYPSSFEFNGINYHSTEQLIQHQKAKLFGDKHIEHSILTAKSLLECKKLSRDISSFNYKRWVENAKDLCKDDIEAKFVQNPRTMQALLETGNKKLVKCTKDYLWGTGVPLNDPQCLTEKCWKGQGLQGIMLQEIQKKHM